MLTSSQTANLPNAPRRRILLTPGEPAGIGPDLVVELAQREWSDELVVVADPDLLKQRAQSLKKPLAFMEADLTQPACANPPSTLKIIPLSLASPCQVGQIDRRNAPYVIDCLTRATQLCLKKQADALVTGPVHKAILNEAGIPFTGHTEFLARACNQVPVVMLFVTPTLKVALATTHLPLAQVPNALTPTLMTNTLRTLHHGLTTRFRCPHPKIMVTGLNPHAGENGHLGREEIDVIQPTLDQLRSEGMDLIGPLPADTIFTTPYLKQADAILALYHDQALPVVKYAGFHQAVNVTLGLPFIRTSVDHGTALDLAGTGRAKVGSFLAAVELALKLEHTQL